MPPQEILKYVKAEPFRPFRLHMVSGRTFDIRHPEMVRVGKRELIIFTFLGGDADVHDDWHTVSPLLIESISNLETPVA